MDLKPTPGRKGDAFAHAAYATYAFLLDPIGRANGELELLFSQFPVERLCSPCSASMPPAGGSCHQGSLLYSWCLWEREEGISEDE